MFYYDIIIQEHKEQKYVYLISKINEDNETEDSWESDKKYGSRADAFKDAEKQIELIMKEEHF